MSSATWPKSSAKMSRLPKFCPAPAANRAQAAKKRTRSDQVASLEQEFRLALGVKVEIKANSRGRGKLVIHFANHDEFDRLREQLTDAFDQFAEAKERVRAEVSAGQLSVVSGQSVAN